MIICIVNNQPLQIINNSNETKYHNPIVHISLEIQNKLHNHHHHNHHKRTNCRKQKNSCNQHV
jgi:hypothetical protein